MSDTLQLVETYPKLELKEVRQANVRYALEAYWTLELCILWICFVGGGTSH